MYIHYKKYYSTTEAHIWLEKVMFHHNMMALLTHK